MSNSSGHRSAAGQPQNPNLASAGTPISPTFPGLSHQLTRPEDEQPIDRAAPHVPTNKEKFDAFMAVKYAVISKLSHFLDLNVDPFEYRKMMDTRELSTSPSSASVGSPIDDLTTHHAKSANIIDELAEDQANSSGFDLYIQSVKTTAEDFDSPEHKYGAFFVNGGDDDEEWNPTISAGASEHGDSEGSSEAEPDDPTPFTTQDTLGTHGMAEATDQTSSDIMYSPHSSQQAFLGYGNESQTESSPLIALRTRARLPLVNVEIDALERQLYDPYDITQQGFPAADAPSNFPPSATTHIGHQPILDHSTSSQTVSGSINTVDLSQSGMDQLSTRQYQEFLKAFATQGTQIPSTSSSAIPPTFYEDDANDDEYVPPVPVDEPPPDVLNESFYGSISPTEVHKLIMEGPEYDNRMQHLHGPKIAGAPVFVSNSPQSLSQQQVEIISEMTTQQRNKVHEQVLNYFQLLIQVLLLARSIEGQSHIAHMIWKKINQFLKLSCKAMQQYRPPPAHMAIARHFDLQTKSDSVTTIGPIRPPQEQTAAADFAIKVNMPPPTNQGNADTTDSNAATNTRGSSPNNPEISPTRIAPPQTGPLVRPFFGSVIALPTATFDNMEALFKLQLVKGVLLEKDYVRFLDLYKPWFDSKLLPKPDTRATLSLMTIMSQDSNEGKANALRSKWSPAEDALLAMGFDLFHKDWKSIQIRLLPTKSVSDISTRFKNKTNRKAKSNPVKESYAEYNKPLTHDERDLLFSGVAQYGQNWDEISVNMLPSRKPSALAALWKTMMYRPKKPPTIHSSKSMSGRSSGETTPQDQGSSSDSSSTSSTSSSSSSSSKREKANRKALSDQEANQPSTNDAGIPATASTGSAPIGNLSKSVPPSSYSSTETNTNSIETKSSRRRSRSNSSSSSSSSSSSKSSSASERSGRYRSGSSSSYDDLIVSSETVSSHNSARDDASSSSNDFERNQHYTIEGSHGKRKHRGHGDMGSVKAFKSAEDSTPHSTQPPRLRSKSDSKPKVQSNAYQPRVYPDTFTTKRFDASFYIDTILDWEDIWENERIASLHLQKLEAQKKGKKANKKAEKPLSADDECESSKEEDFEFEVWLSPIPVEEADESPLPEQPLLPVVYTSTKPDPTGGSIDFTAEVEYLKPSSSSSHSPTTEATITLSNNSGQVFQHTSSQKLQSYFDWMEQQNKALRARISSLDTPGLGEALLDTTYGANNDQIHAKEPQVEHNHKDDTAEEYTDFTFGTT